MDTQQGALKRLGTVVAARAERCTVPIVVGTALPEEVGSGLFMRVSGDPFIITARHLFKDNVAMGKGGVIIPRKGDGYVQLSPKTRITHDHGVHDLAMVRLSPQNEADLRDGGYEPASTAILHSPPDGAAAFGICGYPRDFVKGRPGHITVEPGVIVGLAPTDGHTFERFDPRSEFAFAWPSVRSPSLTQVDGSAVEAPEPYGFSGGGIWQARAADHEGWLPDDIRLAGIQVSWDSVSQIRATRTSAVVAFLRGAAPEFARPLDLVLATRPSPRFVVVPRQADDDDDDGER